MYSVSTKTKDLLEKKYGHSRDCRIQFFEEGHKYVVDNKHCSYANGWCSSTAFCKPFCRAFPGRTIANRIVNSHHFPDAQKYAKYRSLLLNDNGTKRTSAEIVEAILQSWDQNRDKAAEEGTLMHEAIEWKYNVEPHMLESPPPGITVKEDNSLQFDTQELQMFHQFDLDFQRKGFQPYRTEWYVFDEDMKVCGAIDFVMYKPEDQTYHIFDWKRSKQIKTTGSRMLHCLSHLRDCNFYKYALQLNTYKYILEQKYGIIISTMRLVVLHPSQQQYLTYMMPNLQAEIRSMIKYRQRQWDTKNKPIPVDSVFLL